MPQYYGSFLLDEGNRSFLSQDNRVYPVSSCSHSWCPEITVVDTAYLNRKWQELSEYCHMQFRPVDTFESAGREFQKQGFALIREVLQKFHEWEYESNCAVLVRSSLPGEVRDVYDKYIREEIDAGQAQRMLLLMEPVLRARRGLDSPPLTAY
jgi:hypothetical protein